MPAVKDSLSHLDQKRQSAICEDARMRAEMKTQFYRRVEGIRTITMGFIKSVVYTNKCFIQKV